MNIHALEVFLISGPITEEFAEKNPMVSRTIEIRGDQTLEDLHSAIFKAFNREEQHFYEFQVGGKGPNDSKARRYILAAPIDKKPGKKDIQGDVRKTIIDSLNLKIDEAFGYWFDFGDDWWQQINVDSIENRSPKAKYPRVTKRVGKSPPQYADFEEEDD